MLKLGESPSTVGVMRGHSSSSPLQCHEQKLSTAADDRQYLSEDEEKLYKKKKQKILYEKIIYKYKRW